MSHYQHTDARLSEKHTWVPTEDESAMRDHNDALSAEWLVTQLAQARAKVLGRLSSLGAIDSDMGWAVFHDYDDGALATGGQREVLIISNRIPRALGGIDVPFVRVITNEGIAGETVNSCIAEDMTLWPDGDAQYAVDAITVGRYAGDGKPFHEAIKETAAQLFYVADDKVHFRDNYTIRTPEITLPIELSEGEVYNMSPFGNGTGYVDTLYVVEKLHSILDSVEGIQPMYQYAPTQGV